MNYKSKNKIGRKISIDRKEKLSKQLNDFLDYQRAASRKPKIKKSYKKK